MLPQQNVGAEPVGQEARGDLPDAVAGGKIAVQPTQRHRVPVEFGLNVFLDKPPGVAVQVEHEGNAICQRQDQEPDARRRGRRDGGHCGPPRGSPGAAQLQRNQRSARKNVARPQASKMASRGGWAASDSPSSITARRASFNGVNGRALMNGWAASGKRSDERRCRTAPHGQHDQVHQPETASIVLARLATNRPMPAKVNAPSRRAPAPPRCCRGCRRRTPASRTPAGSAPRAA